MMIVRRIVSLVHDDEYVFFLLPVVLAWIFRDDNIDAFWTVVD